MPRPRRGGGPEFVRFFAPLVETLRALGESGRPKELSQKIADQLHIPEHELNRTNKNGKSRFENQVAWARFYLAKAGLIDTSKRGVWALTEQGRQSQLDHDGALRIFHEVQAKVKATKEPEVSDETQAPANERGREPKFPRSNDQPSAGTYSQRFRAAVPAGFARSRI